MTPPDPPAGAGPAPGGALAGRRPGGDPRRTTAGACRAPAGALAFGWYALARGIVEAVCRVLWRVRVRGREHVPSSGAFVLAPVHRSNVDTLIAGCVVRRRVRFMGKDSLWKYRWSGRLFTSLGGFPVHRGTPDREALRTCEAALAAGEPVVLFPEGTRQSGPVVQPLFEGAVFVAARAGVPIVPVGIGGSEGAMPKGSRLVRPVRISVVVGASLQPPPRGAGGRVSRRAVAELTAQLHGELQRLFDEARRDAGQYP
ncbi:MAG TPA: lysophospholipid acyltransferase family protein [Acidimicrobiales bacterium]|nr:lysophospholipid acyltransferase family protein [Acidimicrobiales bacterium]